MLQIKDIQMCSAIKIALFTVAFTYYEFSEQKEYCDLPNTWFT